MQITTIISAIIILALAVPARAETQKEKVIIYNLSITHQKSTPAGTGKKGEEERFDYYSLIIPHAVMKHLNASGNIEARVINGELSLENIGSDEFYARMAAIGKEHSARYLVGGNVTVSGKILTAELTLVNIRGKAFATITRETFETGAEMRTIIADLAAAIEQKISTSIEESRQTEKKAEKEKETRPPEAVPVSPFLKMYRVLDDFSFGVKTGHFFIKGAFSKIYEDSEYISPYITYDILQWLGVTAQVDYLTADNGSIIVRNHSSMALWGMTLNADATWWFFSRFGVRLSAGFGASIGRIYLRSSDNPFQGINTQKKSYDPYLSVSAVSVIRFSPVEIQFGGSYKSAFFKGKSLSLLAVFFGIGYHL